MLTHIHGAKCIYSHKEIAEELGISETTSRSQLQRARVLLQSKIKERY